MTTAADIRAAIAHFHRNAPIVVPNKRDFLNLFTESDVVVSTMSGQLLEYEIKVTRSDYLRDASKRRNRIYSGAYPLEGKRPNRFFYATAAGIITEADLPSWAGWYELNEAGLELRRKAPLLHKERHELKVILQLARAMRARSAP